MHMFYMQCGNIGQIVRAALWHLLPECPHMQDLHPVEWKLVNMCQQLGQDLDGTVPPARPAAPRVKPGAHAHAVCVYICIYIYIYGLSLQCKQQTSIQ